LRIAIISDLHGNLEALESFHETYDELWVLGDLVNYGPSPREVIDWVRSHASLVVRGNHDNAIGCDEDPRCSPRYREMARATADYTSSVLTKSEKEYLGNLPFSASRTVDGKRFVLFHATPSNPLFEYLAPDSEKWPDLADEAQADVLLVGHTHVPFLRRERGRVIVNPGSLGQPKNGKPEACFAVWTGRELELHSFAYPHKKTITKLDTLPLPKPVIDDLATVLRTGSNPA
jgi:putative phosphoesterase